MPKTQPPTIKKTDLLFPELSYKVVGVLFEVYYELGAGHYERVYQRAIAKAFQLKGINHVEQQVVDVPFHGESVGKYLLDFVIDNKIILELKQGAYFRQANLRQIKAYLKALKIQLALLACFTPKGVLVRRIVNTQS